MDSLADIIETAYEHRSEISPTTVDKKTKEAILQAIALLDSGQARVAEPVNGQWQVNQWLKKAVLLYFGIAQNSHFQDGMTQYYDKVPLKFAQLSPEELKSTGVRIVPPACVRQGAFIAANTVLMPSYVNIGAFIDEGTLIDTWATVGSCVQVGKHVHISGGAGLGGVLEPVQANPTIIEDNCFIGARSEIVEGVIVERNSVISMGVFIGQSTKIYHRETGEISYGRVPAGSVVVPGNLPAKDGSHSLYCAVIVKQVDEKTRHKVAINDLLRDIN